MNRKQMGRMLAVGLGAFAALAAVPLPSAWSHWRYSCLIKAEPTDTVRLVRVALPQDVYLHAENSLADVRVIDDAGDEVPYAEQRWQNYDEPRRCPAQIIESSFSPGHYTQLVLDLGSSSAAFHDAVEIGVSEDEFMEWVEVDASDDAQVWRIVQDRAPIFRFAREGHQGTD